ncbi:hypothetical protein EJ110_NYTH34066 [Nymphaea thermarum]|nr:hypothetical protein EJ110_NYTH34066 [Nymphaea thermarum]
MDSPLRVPLGLDGGFIFQPVLKENMFGNGNSRMKKEDVKIEVEEGKVVKIGGKRKRNEEMEADGEKWHGGERPFRATWMPSRGT